MKGCFFFTDSGSLVGFVILLQMQLLVEKFCLSVGRDVLQLVAWLQASKSRGLCPLAFNVNYVMMEYCL